MKTDFQKLAEKKKADVGEAESGQVRGHRALLDPGATKPSSKIISQILLSSLFVTWLLILTTTSYRKYYLVHIHS